MLEKIVCDIDGVLCANGYPDEYNIALPYWDAIESLNKYSEEGIKVILHTARLEEDRKVTEEWLSKHGVTYDELLMGKPTADAYIDDKAIRYFPVQNAKLERKKLGICFSGGMDSYIAYHYAIKKYGMKPEDIICLNFDISHPYYEKEKNALDSFGIDYKTMKVDLCREDLANVPDITNYVIPARNMIFASIMGSLADCVWISGMKFENHALMYDKNEHFFQLASLMLTQSTGKSTVVESPFLNMTKTDTIAWALANGITKEDLAKTTSCYHPTKHRCGECSLCFKRNIAMLANGIEEEYDTDPMQSAEATKLITKYKKALADNDFSHYKKARILETLRIYDEYSKK